jgi:release factor glutamine methyltransferase
MSGDPRHVLPTHERRRLLSVVTGHPLAEVYDGMELTDRQARRYRQLGLRRMDGEPLQYLEGTVQFGPIAISIDKRALIPRPETERLWERCVELLDEPEFVLDLCTGSGCLALALKHKFPGAHVVGTDVSPEALGLANQNAKTLGAIVEFREGDLYEALPEDLMGAFDLIVSNPPYVEDDAFLPMEIREHEPALALRAGDDGLSVLRPLIADARRWLAPGGILALEIGETQGEDVAALCGIAGFDASVEEDLAGRDRYVIAAHR